MISPQFETVYGITDYVDGILAGVADYRGHPHVFVIDRTATSSEEPLYSLWPVELPEVIGQLSGGIWDPSPKLAALVSLAPRGARQGAARARGNFQPNACAAEPNEHRAAMLLAWEEQ